MIKNLVLLTGEDDFRLRERMRFYRQAFQQKYADGTIENYEEKNTFSELENAVLTQNLFGEKKLIFCENFWSPETFEKAEKSEFFSKLPDFEDFCTVIVVEPKIDKRKKYSKFLLSHAKVERFDPLEENEILHWIVNFTQKKGGKITHKASQLLLRRCGENLWNLSQEIQKLVSATQEGEVTEDLIMSLTIPHPKVVIWEFLECLSRKNMVGAIEKFRNLLQMGESVHQIFAMIIREVRIHTLILSGIEQNLSSKELASQAGLHPFVLQKTMPLSRKFTLDQMGIMYDQLVAIDKKLKTGGLVLSTNDQSEFELQIEKFIISFGSF